MFCGRSIEGRGILPKYKSVSKWFWILIFSPGGTLYSALHSASSAVNFAKISGFTLAFKIKNCRITENFGKAIQKISTFSIFIYYLDQERKLLTI